ncbi:MAG TPA: type II toxin-antitoxin system prevent-host-death family antitoxin [Solirubrobacteraceae bacterium]|jgi:prevent-host-death family protein|nr:type II toxin-antitoxin system prevent-host-death family antitoxin [Solirubrobacteraceae bacterium]
MDAHDNTLSRAGTPLGVAEAKRRFSELIDRVDAGERFVVSRRGRPAVVLGPPTPEALRPPARRPVGLAAVAGALADWEDLDEAVREIYLARRHSHDRAAPDLG